MTSFGDCVGMEYLEAFRRSDRGGDPRPIGVDVGDCRWNSANSAFERTRRRGGRVDVASLVGD